MIYWFTGQPGHGKTTLAEALIAQLRRLGYAPHHIDGDDLKHGFKKVSEIRASKTDFKADRVHLFARQFMRKDYIQIIGMQRLKMHPEVIHSFIKEKVALI